MGLYHSPEYSSWAALFAYLDRFLARRTV